MVSLVNSTKYWKKITTNLSQSVSKKRKGNNFKQILWNQLYTDTEIKQRQKYGKNLQVNIPNKHKYENP
jgi:hypothetical protein